MKLTYVYAMRNKRNGYTKIGRSDNPDFREKTLQSEEPEVEILFYYLCHPRVETDLHSHYADKRLRGEWFDLTNEDVFYVWDWVRCFVDEQSHYVSSSFAPLKDEVLAQIAVDDAALEAAENGMVQ